MDSAFKKVDLLERTYAQPVRTGGPSTILLLLLICKFVLANLVLRLCSMLLVDRLFAPELITDLFYDNGVH